MKSKMAIIFSVLFFCLLQPVAARSQVAVVGSLTHEKTVATGGTYSGVATLRNYGDEPKEVRAYQTDYLFFADGRQIYGQPGKDPRSNARWIIITPKRVMVPPKGTVTVNYTVNVPHDAALEGTYWSMLMIEGIAKDSPESSQAEKDPEKGDVSLGFRQILRYGLQMVTHIEGTGTSKLKFINTKLLKEDERTILQVDLENSGERWLRPVLWVELYDEKGRLVARLEGKKRRIYPDTSARFKVNSSAVSKGLYHAMVVADCGGDAVFGATYTLELEK